MKKLICLLFLGLVSFIQAQKREIPYRYSDRDQPYHGNQRKNGKLSGTNRNTTRMGC